MNTSTLEGLTDQDRALIRDALMNGYVSNMHRAYEVGRMTPYGQHLADRAGRMSDLIHQLDENR